MKKAYKNRTHYSLKASSRKRHLVKVKRVVGVVVAKTQTVLRLCGIEVVNIFVDVAENAMLMVTCTGLHPALTKLAVVIPAGI